MWVVKENSLEHYNNREASKHTLKSPVQQWVTVTATNLRQWPRSQWQQRSFSSLPRAWALLLKDTSVCVCPAALQPQPCSPSPAAPQPAAPAPSPGEILPFCQAPAFCKIVNEEVGWELITMRIPSIFNSITTLFLNHLFTWPNSELTELISWGESVYTIHFWEQDDIF